MVGHGSQREGVVMTTDVRLAGAPGRTVVAPCSVCTLA